MFIEESDACGSHTRQKQREQKKRQKRLLEDVEVLKLEVHSAKMSCSMPELPDDIVFCHVFIRLPAKSIARFRCVCKPWRCFLTDLNFIRRHHNRISKFRSPHKHLIMHSCGQFHTFVEEDQELTDAFPRKFPLLKNQFTRYIWGSASGLILFELNFKKFVIWNPSTGDYKRVPDPNPPLNHRKPQVIGLGYDSSIDEYKLVRFFPFHLNEVDIYSLKSNSWTKFQLVFPIDFIPSYLHCYRHGYAVDGFIFWLLNSPFQGHNPVVILSFDLKENKFRCLQLGLFYDYKRKNICLQVMRGSLVILETTYSTGQVEKWVMRKEEDNNKQWHWVWDRSTMVVPSRTRCLPEYVQPICTLNNGKWLMFDCARNSKRLYVYDPNSGRLYDLHINGIDYLNQHIMYVETLASPNAWGG